MKRELAGEKAEWSEPCFASTVKTDLRRRRKEEDHMLYLKNCLWTGSGTSSLEGWRLGEDRKVGERIGERNYDRERQAV